MKVVYRVRVNPLEWGIIPKIVKPIMTDSTINTIIPEEMAGQRLDVALAELYPDYSRNRLKQWILQGQDLLNGQQVEPREKLLGNEALEITFESAEHESTCIAEDISLDVVYEDESLIIINKPADFVVHPAAGHYSGTLQNALLHYDNRLEEVPRAGIVHRIDKDTTGLLVVARTLISHRYLVKQLQARDMHREYQAVVHGVMTAGGFVEQPIGRHPRERIRMAVRENGKPSLTHYRVQQRFREHTHIHVKLDTGRTHQIRVHMQHIRHPIVGDPVYSGRARIPSQASESLIQTLRQFKRQALHAFQLSLTHPESKQEMSWQAPLPEDFRGLLSELNEDAELHAGDNV